MNISRHLVVSYP